MAESTWSSPDRMAESPWPNPNGLAELLWSSLNRMAESPWPSPKYIWPNHHGRIRMVWPSPWSNPNGMAESMAESERYGRVHGRIREVWPSHHGRIREYFGRITCLGCCSQKSRIPSASSGPWCVRCLGTCLAWLGNCLVRADVSSFLKCDWIILRSEFGQKMVSTNNVTFFY